MKLVLFRAFKTQKGTKSAGPKANQNHRIRAVHNAARQLTMRGIGVWILKLGVGIIAGIILNPTQMNKLSKLAKYESKDMFCLFHPAAGIGIVSFSKLGFPRDQSCENCQHDKEHVHHGRTFQLNQKTHRKAILHLVARNPDIMERPCTFKERDLHLRTLFDGNQANLFRCSWLQPRTPESYYRKDLAWNQFYKLILIHRLAFLLLLVRSNSRFCP